MAKPQKQRTKEYLDRLRRKAQAYDRIVTDIKAAVRIAPHASNEVVAAYLNDLVEYAEKAVQE